MVSKNTKRNKKYIIGIQHREMILDSPESFPDIYIWNSAFNSCTDYITGYAWLLYMKNCGIVYPNTTSYNKLLCLTERMDQAIDLMSEMDQLNIPGDYWSYNILLRRWIRDFDKSWYLYLMIRKKFGVDSEIFNILISKTTSIKELYHVYDEILLCGLEIPMSFWSRLVYLSPTRSCAKRYMDVMKRCGVEPSRKCWMLLREKLD